MTKAREENSYSISFLNFSSQIIAAGKQKSEKRPEG